ncbi:MAG TPA: ATP-binding cassette domain-containing protein [Candidatus Dormibacteraeota bacterium]|nr:ATP-binding cassette domain-containing protein [Candidatus Dormibacteraeota bacterium]
MTTLPVMELTSVSKSFGSIAALRDVTVSVYAGKVLCLLGDNGAGKSTLIKIMSGVYSPSSGAVRVDGKQVTFASPRNAQELGIATVHQDVGLFPLMSVVRNFFVGREPLTGWGPFKRIDMRRAEQIALSEARSMGLTRVANPHQLVGSMSGGEQQALAIGRALFFGARLLILDEPTSALGVNEAAVVLRLVQQLRAKGIAIVFITHNAHHALTVGDEFIVLIRGSIAAHFNRGEKKREEVLDLMAGGKQLHSLEMELEDQ